MTEALRYEPAHLSYSAIDSYLRCGKAFQLERVVKVPRSSAWYFVGGSSVHELTEEIDRSVFFDPDVTLAALADEDLSADFRRVFDRLITQEEDKTSTRKEEWTVSGVTKALPSGKDYWWWLEQGPKLVSRWVNWRLTSGWQLWEFEGDPAIEVPLNVSLTVDPSLKAFPDRVMVTPSGELAVVDIKTGVRNPESDLQLGVYAVAMEKAGLPRPIYGTYWMALKGEHTVPVPLDQYTESVIDEMFRQFYTGTQAGLFTPRTGEHCRYMCSVAEYCHVKRGPKAHLYDPLSPDYTGVRDSRPEGEPSESPLVAAPSISASAADGGHGVDLVAHLSQAIRRARQEQTEEK